MNERPATHSDKPYKRAFVGFIKSKKWHWFITIPIGMCHNDDEVLRRLRRIENDLCRKYLVSRYHKLPDVARFSLVVGFEGERKSGTRHAHILVYIPVPTKKRISHAMLVNLLPSEFRYRWTELRDDRSEVNKHNSFAWADDIMALSFGPGNVARSIYTVKDVRQRDVPWSRFEFVTLPKERKLYTEKVQEIADKIGEQRLNYARVWADRRSRLNLLGQRLNRFKNLTDPLLTSHVV